jgi:hypothetical protein
VLLPSRFGYILSGNRSGISVNVAAVNLLNLEMPGPLPETEIKRFWDLETIGIKGHKDKWRNTRDSAVLQASHVSFRIDDSRSVVSVTRKENVKLQSNRENTENRIKSLEFRLKKNANLRRIYHTHMLDYIQSGQVEVVDAGEEHGDLFNLPIVWCPKVHEETPNDESCSTHPHMRKEHLP